MKVSAEIATLVPYVPGKPIDEAKREFGLREVIKLASNENALGVSPQALAAMQKALQDLNRYPDPGCYRLVAKLSDKHQLEPAQILIGNGSNELIDLLIRVYCEPGDCVLTTEAAFIAYKICAQAARVKAIEVALGDDFRVDPQAMIAAVSRHRPKIVFLANPNNPTGCYIPHSEMETLLRQWGGRDDLLVVIDEAYLEFVRATDYPKALDLLRRFPNVVVLHTMSKVYGLAGIRVGALYAHPEICDYIHRVRNPFNVNTLAQVAACAALDDDSYVQASQNLVWQGLDYFYQQLQHLQLPFTRSQANFVLFDTGRDADEVYQQLLRRGVILRPVKPYGLQRHLRMSVGLKHENEGAMAAIAEVLG